MRSQKMRLRACVEMGHVTSYEVPLSKALIVTRYMWQRHGNRSRYFVRSTWAGSGWYAGTARSVGNCILCIVVHLYTYALSCWVHWKGKNGRCCVLNMSTQCWPFFVL